MYNYEWGKENEAAGARTLFLNVLALTRDCSFSDIAGEKCKELRDPTLRQPTTFFFFRLFCPFLSFFFCLIFVFSFRGNPYVDR